MIEIEAHTQLSLGVGIAEIKDDVRAKSPLYKPKQGASSSFK